MQRLPLLLEPNEQKSIGGLGTGVIARSKLVAYQDCQQEEEGESVAYQDSQQEEAGEMGFGSSLEVIVSCSFVRRERERGRLSFPS